MPERISVVINTLNEEARLPWALRSVGWADERVVVDMHSDDGTADVARRLGARVVLHERTGVVEPARAFAIAQCAGDWVLILDADEMIPAALSRALVTLAARGDADAARVSLLHHAFGAPLRGGGWGPHQDRQLRFFRRGAVVPPDRIHGRVEPRPGTRVAELPADAAHAIVHFNYLDAEHFLDKLNRYTTAESQGAFARGERAGALRVARDLAREVVGRYFRHGGWRDGWRGAALVLLMIGYRLATTAKLRELQAGATRERATAAYREVAEEVLRGYGGESGTAAASKPQASASL